VRLRAVVAESFSSEVNIGSCLWRGGICLAVAVVMLGFPPAWGFDYARYQPTDLDALMAQPRPARGVDIHPALPLKLEVTLLSYAEGCRTELLKKTMITGGFAKEQVDGLQVMGCIKVRSAQGKELRIFIQDVVSSFLPREVPLGSPVTLFAIHVFTSPEGPGLLVNEYSTEAGNDPAKSSSDQGTNGAPCGCGTADFHPGIDVTNDVAGAPIQAVDDGIVVKVEEDEQAAVDVPNIGRCGRYVVVKHSYPNGHVAFTRYAQLGRIVDAAGRPIAPGTPIKKSDKIGEVGSRKILHFEIRPVAPGTTEQGADWTARYGADPTMEWSRYQPVDPGTFDPDTFGKIGESVK
jgi:murein DD-endopeptidase MepM/ murein hydrolase activator NlpD